MKKRLFILLVVLAVAVSVLAVTANADTEVCPYCGQAPTWTALTVNTQKMTDGHYYLTGDLVSTKHTIADGKVVCLDLKGYNYTSNQTIVVESGGTLNMWNGNIKARGNEGYNGGVWDVKNDGTLTAENVNITKDTYDRKIVRGGFLHLEGTATLKNATLDNGVATDLGGNIFVSSTGDLTLDNTTVTGGTAGNTNAPNSYCVYAQGPVTLEGDSNIELLQLVSENDSTAISELLDVQSSYTGAALLALSGINNEGQVAGNVQDDADLSHLTLVDSDLLLQQQDEKLITYLPSPVAVMQNGDVIEEYDTMAEALKQLAEGQTLKLQRCLDKVTVDQNVTLDLNGHDLTEVEVTEGTLYVMDSQTDDYTVSNGVYGKIKTIIGNVEGVTVDENQRYLSYTEDSGTSFHKLHMELHEITLRPGKVALYFNSIFKGDEKVQAQISTFGVSMGLDKTELDKGTLTPGTYTAISPSKFNGSGDTTSSLLTNIMRTDHGNITNRRNAATTVYGRPYIKLNNNDDILWGTTAGKSLQETVQSIDGYIAEYKAKGEEFLTETQERALLDMYYKFKKVMSKWSILEVKAAYDEHEKETLKILTIGNSHANDSNWQLRNVFQQQDPDQKVVVGILYYSGCKVSQHVNFAKNNSAVYQYYKNETGTWENDEPKDTMRKALEDEQWDIVLLQDSNVALGQESTFQNDNLQYLIDYVYAHTDVDPEIGFNMVWANPVTPTYLHEDTRMTHSMEDGESLDGFITSYEEIYNNDQQHMFQCMLDNTNKYIVNNDAFNGAYIMPSGTAVQYANDVLGMTDLDLYRDYTHLSDISRLMVSYLWYAKLTDKGKLTSIDVDVIPAELRHSRFKHLGDLTITDEMKEFMLEAINYALSEPFESVEEPTEQVDPTNDGVLNVLMIGNSFSYYFTDELKAMADAAGQKLQVYNVHYDGCTLYQHYQYLLDGKQVYTLRKNGTEEIDTNLSLWTCINYESINWDIISLQEGSSVVRSADLTDADVTELYATNVKYFSHLYEFVREKFPKSRIAFHQTWAYQVGTTTTGFTTADATAQAAHHQRIRAYTQKFVDRYRDTMDLVNTGDAWAIVREDGYDKLCARLGKNVTGAHTGDNYHDGDIGGGQFLNACVWYEYLFENLDVRDNTFVPTYNYSNYPGVLDTEPPYDGAYELNEGITVKALRTAACTAYAQRLTPQNTTE